MSQKTKKDEQSKDSRAFNMRPKYAQFVEENKDENKYRHFLKYGYDFAKLAAAIAKAKKIPSEPLKGKSEKIFEKEQFQNNPDIDLIFQIIAYSEALKEKSDEDSHLVLANLNKCREISEGYCNAGFYIIAEELFKSEAEDVNSHMVDYLSDEKLLIESIVNYEIED